MPIEMGCINRQRRARNVNERRRAVLSATICLLLAVIAGTKVTVAEEITLRVSVRVTPQGEDPILAEVVQEIVDMFQQENPGIKVEVLWGQREEQLILLTAAGTPPDVFHETIDAVLLPARNGLLMPLNSYYARDKASFSALLPGVADAFRIGDNLYALPESWGATVTAFNLAMFDNAGLPYPRSTWTWEEWLQISRKLTRDRDGDGIPDVWASYNWGLADWTIEHIFSNGGFFASPDLKEWGGNQKETIESLQFMADAVNQHRIIPRPSEARAMGAGARAWHEGGKFAMEKIGPWDVLVQREANKFAWDVIDNPIHSRTGRAGARSNASGWAIHRDSKHPEAAWKLLKFILSEQVQRRITLAGLGVPARADVAQRFFIRPETPQDEAVFLRASEYMQFTYHDLWPREITTQLRQTYQRIMDGSVSPVVAMQEITPSILATIRAQK
jgi:multiple sugar transport system substrate-binding protein